jgi:hypothetical protein
MLKAGQIKVLAGGALAYVKSNPDQDAQNSAALAAHGNTSADYFNYNQKQLPVNLSSLFVDFDSCSRLKMIDSRTVRVNNTTYGRICCAWIVPKDGEEYAFILIKLRAQRTNFQHFATHCRYCAWSDGRLLN